MLGLSKEWVESQPSSQEPLQTSEVRLRSLGQCPLIWQGWTELSQPKLLQPWGEAAEGKGPWRRALPPRVAWHYCS